MQIVRRIMMTVGAAVLLVSAAVRAETCTLELKRLSSPSGSRGTSRPQDYAFRYVSSQHFFYQVGRMSPMGTTRGAAKFADVVKKEPVKYNAKNPFRGVAKLGDQNFGFVFDSEPVQDNAAKGQKKTNEKKDTVIRTPPSSQLARYSRLHFDLNHNGDLTDDKVIESARKAVSIQSSYANYTFPRVDVTVEADGAKMEYAFLFSVYSSGQASFQYASASLNAAAYRAGEIVLDGKKRRVFVVDHNSNGRFDDVSAVNNRIRTHDGQLYATQGDMIYVDPKLEENVTRYGYYVTRNDEQHYVSNQINIDGRFYDLKISPAGDKLTLTPSSVAVGYVTNPNMGFRAVLSGEKGLIKISGGKSGRAPVPAGDWRLLSYTIDRTGLADEKPKPAQDTGSLLDVLSKAVKTSAASTTSSRSGDTIVAANGTHDCKAVTVEKGKAVVLPFGPPYTPVVKVSSRSGSGTVSLGMSLVGAGGEVCSDLRVNGGRPPDPEFTITGPDGQEVQAGKFKYG